MPQVTLTPSGDFVEAQPNAQPVDRGDSVQWISANPFQIQFAHGTPFDVGIVDQTTGPVAVLQGAPKRAYSYAVAIWDEAAQRVRMTPGSPFIIVK